MSDPITVFGAGGRAGRAVVAEARRRDLSVRAVVRRPSSHDSLRGPGVELVAGDITDRASCERVSVGSSALVNTVTPFSAPPASFDDFDLGYYAAIVDNLVAATRSTASRVVEVGLAATLRTETGRLFEDPSAFPPLLAPFATARVRGLERWTNHTSGPDWLILTPPPQLSGDARSRGAYRLADDRLDQDAAAVPLSYDDLARAIVDEIQEPTAHRAQCAVYGTP